jgi:hypothetical protein
MDLLEKFGKRKPISDIEYFYVCPLYVHDIKILCKKNFILILYKYNNGFQLIE